MKIQVWGAGVSSDAKPKCSFCGRGPDENRRILIAPEASICQECVESAEAVLTESLASR